MRSNPKAKRQDGVALISALWLVIVVLGIVTTGVIVLQSHRAKTRIAFARNSQAMQIARSGLVEARSWLRRQTSQPVVAFEPALDALAVPPILDTIDPDIGIVREFRVTGQTWARYEVWKQWDADPDLVRRALRQQLQCEDITRLRGIASDGAVWRLRCMGYIYNREDANTPFDEQPNHVIAKELLEVECERLLLQTPGEAAVNVGDGNSCLINTQGRIRGNSAGGIYYPASSGTPTTGPSGEQRVLGTPRLASGIGYDDSFEAVFSVSLDEIKAMASMVLTDCAQIPDPVPDGSIIVCEQASMQFDSSHPLRGNGLLVLVGNVTMPSGNNSNFSGFVYIDGGFTMRGPSEIRGAVIVTGNMTVQGQPDYATIEYDEGVLSTLRASFGSYNISSSFKRLMQEVE